MAAEPRYLTAEEYLSLERHAPSKSEYLDGTIVAMAGASEEHNLIFGNMFASLHPQLGRRGCRVYPRDMRVKIAALNIYTYPDLSIACGESQFDEGKRDSLLNPTVIVEILSPSTAMYDRTTKFARYRHLPSLREYILVTQDAILLEHFVRQPDDRWLWAALEQPTDTLTLASVGCVLSLAEIYASVPL